MNKEVKTGVYFKGEESFNFDFYTNIDMENKLEFVNSVINILVDGQHYNSIIRSLVFDFFIVEIFTSIDTKKLKESSYFIRDVEQFLIETNIANIVKVNMVDGLLEELNHAIDLNIQYLTGIHPNPLNEALTSLINTIEKKVNGIDLGNVMNMANMFSEMNNEFTTENVVNAYLKSDVYKKNLEEITDSKLEIQGE